MRKKNEGISFFFETAYILETALHKECKKANVTADHNYNKKKNRS